MPVWGLVSLPVHGFVLAGGKSSRMGVDKARLEFCGRPMVEIAVEKLREFCAEVSIVGNREDLSGFAPVVLEGRVDVGPAAGIEAGLMAAREDWVVFVPVDVPLVPGELLRRWIARVVDMGESGLAAAFLVANGEPQPAFCVFRREWRWRVLDAVGRGERRLDRLVSAAGADGETFAWGHDAAEFMGDGMAGDAEVGWWFRNLNTPEDLAEAEGWVGHRMGE